MLQSLGLQASCKRCHQQILCMLMAYGRILLLPAACLWQLPTVQPPKPQLLKAASGLLCPKPCLYMLYRWTGLTTMCPTGDPHCGGWGRLAAARARGEESSEQPCIASSALSAKGSCIVVLLCSLLLRVVAATKEAPYVNDLEYEGPVDGSSRQSCIELFVRYTQALDCQVLPAPAHWTGPNITAELCTLPGNETLASIYTPPQLKAIFHAHLQGPQIIIPPISVCGTTHRDDESRAGQQSADSQAVHRIHLKPQELRAGNYTLTLRLPIHNFTFGTHYPRAASFAGPWQEAYTHPLWQVILNVNSSSRSTYSDASMASWPVCNTTYLEGTVLSSLKVPHDLTRDSGRNASAWRSRVRWQPKGCRLLPVEQINTASCFKDRKICFFGDSHMRHLHNGVTDAANKLRGRDVKGMTDSQAYSHSSCRYIASPWLNKSEIVRGGRYEGCTDVFFNMGNWPVSHVVHARWTAGRYARRIQEAIYQLKALLPKARLHWVTMVSHDWTYYKNGLRFPPYMDFFNDVSKNVALVHGIPVINVWDITAPLYDTTYDLRHHHWHGVAGHHMTEYLLNVLCTQRRM